LAVTVHIVSDISKSLYIFYGIRSFVLVKESRLVYWHILLLLSVTNADLQDGTREPSVSAVRYLNTSSLYLRLFKYIHEKKIFPGKYLADVFNKTFYELNSSPVNIYRPNG